MCTGRHKLPIKNGLKCVSSFNFAIYIYVLYHLGFMVGRKITLIKRDINLVPKDELWVLNETCEEMRKKLSQKQDSTRSHSILKVVYFEKKI